MSIHVTQINPNMTRVNQLLTQIQLKNNNNPYPLTSCCVCVMFMSCPRVLFRFDYMLRYRRSWSDKQRKVQQLIILSISNVSGW